MNVDYSYFQRLSFDRVMAIIVAGYLVSHFHFFVQALALTSLRLIPAIIMLITLISGVVALVGLYKKETWGYIPVLFFIPALTLFSGVLNLGTGGEELIKNSAILLINISAFLFCAWCLMQKMDAT